MNENNFEIPANKNPTGDLNGGVVITENKKGGLLKGFAVFFLVRVVAVVAVASVVAVSVDWSGLADNIFGTDEKGVLEPVKEVKTPYSVDEDKVKEEKAERTIYNNIKSAVCGLDQYIVANKESMRNLYVYDYEKYYDLSLSISNWQCPGFARTADEIMSKLRKLIIDYGNENKTFVGSCKTAVSFANTFVNEEYLRYEKEQKKYDKISPFSMTIDDYGLNNIKCEDNESGVIFYMPVTTWTAKALRDKPLYSAPSWMIKLDRMACVSVKHNDAYFKDYTYKKNGWPITVSHDMYGIKDVGDGSRGDASGEYTTFVCDGLGSSGDCADEYEKNISKFKKGSNPYAIYSGANFTRTINNEAGICEQSLWLDDKKSLLKDYDLGASHYLNKKNSSVYYQE